MKIFQCFCGHEWNEGENGNHSCTPYYERKIDKLTADNAALVEALESMHNLNIKMIRDFNGRVEPWNQVDEEHLHDTGLLLKKAKGDV